MNYGAHMFLVMTLLGNAVGLHMTIPNEKSKTHIRVAVVTEFDEKSKYSRCGWVLLESIRNAGKFKGDLLVLDLTPNKTTGPNSTFIEQIHAFSGKVIKLQTKWPHSQYKKLELFTNPFFRDWDRLIYIDADSVVLGPLDSILYNPLPSGRLIALADNNMYHKRPFDLYTHEYTNLTNKTEFPLGLPPNRMGNIGAANLLVIDIARMTPPKQLKQKLFRLVETLGPFARHFDQSIIHAAWPTELTTLPTCCPPAGDGRANQFICDFDTLGNFSFLENMSDTNAYCRTTRHHMIFHDYKKLCRGHSGIVAHYKNESCSTAAGCLV